MIGTFVKIPHHAVAEVLGLSRLDLICFDAEHAPFDRSALDTVLLASRAAGMPSLVRTARNDAVDILQALDGGATGVVIPHVSTQANAECAARACRYLSGVKGSRGYAGSTRAAAYTTRSMSQVISTSNDKVALVAQIEDAEALDHLDEIASVDGVDCLFVGRADLTVSLGASTPNDRRVVEAVRQICAAGKRHERPVGMFTSDIEEIPHWMTLGASLFLLASDQHSILTGANLLADQFLRLSSTLAVTTR